MIVAIDAIYPESMDHRIDNGTEGNNALLDEREKLKFQ